MILMINFCSSLKLSKRHIQRCQCRLKDIRAVHVVIVIQQEWLEFYQTWEAHTQTHTLYLVRPFSDACFQHWGVCVCECVSVQRTWPLLGNVFFCLHEKPERNMSTNMNRKWEKWTKKLWIGSTSLLCRRCCFRCVWSTHNNTKDNILFRTKWMGLSAVLIVNGHKHKRRETVSDGGVVRATVVLVLLMWSYKMWYFVGFVCLCVCVCVLESILITLFICTHKHFQEDFPIIVITIMKTIIVCCCTTRHSVAFRINYVLHNYSTFGKLFIYYCCHWISSTNGDVKSLFTSIPTYTQCEIGSDGGEGGRVNWSMCAW